MSETKESYVKDVSGHVTHIDHTSRSDVDGTVTRERYEAVEVLGKTTEGDRVDTQITRADGQQWGCLSDGTPVEDRGSDRD